MTMLLELTHLLGTSYYLQVVKQEKAAAAAVLHDALSESDELRQTAEAELDRFKRVIEARTAGACHITKVSHDLLFNALASAKGAEP